MAEPPANDQDTEDVRYDLAGNPLPSRPKVSAPAVAPPPPGGFLAAPLFAPPPAYTPPPGFAPPPGAAPPMGVIPATKPAPSGLSLYGGLALAAVVLVGLIFLVRALRPVMVAAPTSYKTYTAIDNTFSCDQPAGWKMHETGATNGALSTVTFTTGHVKVRVVSDAIGSLMADTTPNVSVDPIPGMPPTPPPKPAVEKLHEMDEKQLESSPTLPGYKEEAMQKLESRVGDARVSEWTADEGKIHGYRATMLGGQREMTVICIAPERNWAVLKPAFQHMITSVVPGNGG